MMRDRIHASEGVGTDAFNPRVRGEKAVHGRIRASKGE